MTDLEVLERVRSKFPEMDVRLNADHTAVGVYDDVLGEYGRVAMKAIDGRWYGGDMPRVNGERPPFVPDTEV